MSLVAFEEPPQISQQKQAAMLPRTRPGRRTSLSQAIAMQQATYECTIVLQGDLKETEDKLLRSRIASGLAQLTKSWELLEDRKRILRGKPLPGSLRPERKAPKRKAQVHAITEAPEQGTDVGTASRPKDSTENKSS